MDDHAPPSRLAVLLFAGLLIVIVVALAVLVLAQPAPVGVTILPPPPTLTPAPSATPAPLMVYVTGAVTLPGQIWTLPPGSRVIDALAAAGGLTAAADPDRVNPAALVRDGDQVHVPERGTGMVLATPGLLIVNVNRATADELAALPGIGPTLAAEIIAYREANGAFSSLIDLDAVPGIGPGLLADIAASVSFE